MSLSIVTFAGLGSRRDHKTSDILPIIEEFEKRGELGGVVCSSVSNFNVPSVKSVVPRLLSSLIRRLKLPRAFAEKVFDVLASLSVTSSTVTLVHPPQYLLTMRKLRSNRSLIVGLVTEAHPLTNRELYWEECKTQNVQSVEHHPWTAKIAEAVMFPEYLIALSPFVKESYVRHGFEPSKIYLATPDISLETFTPTRTTSSKFVVLYVAHTQILKGLGYLLQAWSDLNLVGAELRIVGSTASLPATLLQKYQSITANNQTIVWAGPVLEIQNELSTASVLVVPSLTEGFGRVTLEAMASGIPVITTENARGTVEEKKTGFIVPIRDADAIAEKILYLYDNREVGNEMGRNARIAVENKKGFGESVFEIYQDILMRENSL